MQAILTVTTPFFGLVLLGWLMARRGLLALEAIPGLNGFVLFFALPCMLLRFSAITPIAQLLDGAVVAVYLGCAALMSVLAVALARLQGQRWPDAAFGTLLAVFPNSGFMGVPLLVALLGPRAAAPSIVALALDMVLTSSLCIALSQLGHPGGVRPALARALRGMAVNPLPWAIAGGTLLSALGWRPPTPVWRIVELLADAASPVALFALGGMLARGPMQRAPGAPRPPAAWDIVALKLIVHPLVVLAAGGAARAAGLPLDPFAAVVLVLVAALPSASYVPILAERYGAEPGRLAQVVLLSTVGAFASFALAVAALQPGAGP
ncbi:AEC family transporter [Ideonella sp. 4Y16]|uniref:AEC family transporter n=1 Tax=Ideonella alba TaxID=2824118 RepID=A0A941BHW7_9BURK|nr:AEC family transporter [Ideonella alba]MBQ0932073.1 AEC family transporter [Ideonella alba]MBQ0945645.1 AEC family transporter [Ideonella alba]